MLEDKPSRSGPPLDIATGPAWSEVEDLLGRMAVLHHKINNPLTSLMGRAQMLPLKLRQGDVDQVTKAAEVIEESSRRLATLIQELSRAVSDARERFRAMGPQAGSPPGTD